MYFCRDGGIYTLAGLMQGGEYILSRHATVMHGDRLVEINSEKGVVQDIEYPLTPRSSVINTSFMPLYGGLWITRPQFIVNRYATSVHFAELEDLNFQANVAYVEQEARRGESV